ncbi:MAG TPA: DUF4397 domain-containing protein [Cyclobacteriaceae bacterium]|nr:DUF4397 domain-containing protein [Cyclobacteriaceae bacterium]
MPVAGLSFLHAAPASPSLSVLLDGKILNTSAFNYASYSGYVSVDPGTHPLRFNSSADGSTKLDTSVTVVGDKAFSYFVYNQGAKMKSFIVSDDSPPFALSNGMMVRVVHLSPDLPDVKVVLAGESKSLTEQIGFTDATTFAEYTAKTSTVEIRSVMDGSLITSQGFDPVPRQFLTIAILGYMSPPGGNPNKLTVKVITN